MRKSVWVAMVAISCAASAAAQSQEAAPMLTIDAPMPYQVFQRQTARDGFIAVRGHVNRGAASGDVNQIEVCIREEPPAPEGATPEQCPSVRVVRATGSFNGMIAVPAGGFYTIRLRAIQRSGRRIAEQSVEHVGVGEVFVIAGQSNSTNYGEVLQTVKSGHVTAFDGSHWRIADDPQPGVQDLSGKGSFIPPFGDAMYAKFHVPIGIADVGHGSTSVRQWLPKGERFATQPTMSKYTIEIGPDVWESEGVLFNGMVERIRELDAFAPHNEHGFRALLWHQGESDAHQKPPHEISAAEYRRLLMELIDSSRDDAGWRFPWFVAQASYHAPDDPGAPEIREAQASLWSSGLAFEGPDTDQLTGMNRQNNGAGVHMSDLGLKVHGELWAAKVSVWLEGVLAR